MLSTPVNRGKGMRTDKGGRGQGMRKMEGERGGDCQEQGEIKPLKYIDINYKDISMTDRGRNGGMKRRFSIFIFFTITKKAHMHKK